MLSHKTAGVQSAVASAAAAAADACEQSRFKTLSLETGQLEDTTMLEVSAKMLVFENQPYSQQVERMSLILKKWGYRERMSNAAGNSRDERALMLKTSQNHELRDAVHTEFERFMILAREETARMSAEVKKLFALSMEAAAKLETLDREEAELMAAASIQPPNPSAAADAVALAASGKRTSCFFWFLSASLQPGYMAPTQSRSFSLSKDAQTPPSRPGNNEQLFDVDFSLAEARSRLAAIDVTPAVSSSPVAAQAALQARSPVAAVSSGVGPFVAAESDGVNVSRATEASVPSVADVRKDIAAKRRLALQQATQRK